MVMSEEYLNFIVPSHPILCTCYGWPRIREEEEWLEQLGIQPRPGSSVSMCVCVFEFRNSVSYVMYSTSMVIANGRGYARDQSDLWAPVSFLRVLAPLFLLLHSAPPDAGRQDGVSSSPPPGAESPAARPPRLRPSTLAL